MELARSYSHAFEGATTISIPSNLNDFRVETVRFSPLPDENIIFYFEASNATEIRNEVVSGLFSHGPVPLAAKREFVLKLIKQPTRAKCTSLVMNIVVKVFNSDNSLFMDYGYRPGIKVDLLNNSVLVIGKLSPVFPATMCNDPNKMNALTIGFTMLFSNDSSKSAVKYNEKESSSFFNLKTTNNPNEFTDFIFCVDDVSFPVHKVILAAHSPVFKKMWTIDCKESKKDSVTITDATPAIFGMFLKYLYFGEIEDKSWKSVKNIYYLAHKYDVGTLKNDCSAIAISLLSLNLVCDILKSAYTHNDTNLKLAARKFAADHITELKKKENWKNLEETHLSICYEIVLNIVP